MTSKPHLLRTACLALALALSAGLSAPEVRAQTGEDALRFSQRTPATGARMIGLAGAGIAGVGDYAALYTNPAGLGYFERSAVAGALNTFATTDESVFQTPNFSNPTEGTLRETHLGNLAYVYKAPTRQGSFVVGLGFNQVGTFGRDLQFSGRNATNSITDSFLPYADEYEVDQDDLGYYPVFFGALPELAYNAGAIEFLFENVEDPSAPLFYQAVAPGTTIEQYGNVTEEGRMNELSLGGAVEAARGVMVGLSANLSFGRYRFDSYYEEVDALGENTPEDYVVVLDDGEAAGFDALEYETGFESDLTGFNMRAGISAEVAPAVRLGLSLETPTFYSVSEDYSSNLVTFFDEGGSLSDAQDGTFDYDVTTPWRMGAGLAFDAGAILVTGDVEYVDWSQLELGAEDDTFEDVNRNIRDNLDPVFNTRLGGELRLGSIALRGGVAYQPDPRSSELQDVVDRSKTFFSAGAGYRFSDQLELNVGWIQERFDDLYEPYGDVTTTPPAVEEEVVRHRFAVGVTVGF